MSTEQGKTEPNRPGSSRDGRLLDPLLYPFLRDLDDAEWKRLSADLVADPIDPIIRSVVWKRLGQASGNRVPDSEAEDVCAEALLRLLARLRQDRFDEEPIGDLRSYVATTAGNACDDHLRRKYPERSRLKNRVRYALKHRTEFSLWRDGSGDWHAGLAIWPTHPSPLDSSRLQQLRSDPQSLPGVLPRVDLSGRDLVGLLTALLAWAGQSLEIDELVGAVAGLWGVHDGASLASADETEQGLDQLPDPHPSVAAESVDRTFFERLWNEVRELPPRQRAALLLNLREPSGASVLDLWPATGVASLSDIAAALEMSAEGLAALWNDLPLQDTAIGERLGLTRQQVINLRKSARERLARRMGTGPLHGNKRGEPPSPDSKGVD